MLTTGHRRAGVRHCQALAAVTQDVRVPGIVRHLPQ